MEIRNETNTTVAQFVHGPGIDNPLMMIAFDPGTGVESDRYHYHTDHLGSVRFVTDQAGGVADTYDYTAYGSRLDDPALDATTNPFTYTGREYHARSGLYFYRARWYDPQTGSFTSVDPIGLDGGVNLYGYVGANPVMFGDPLGLQTSFSGAPNPFNVWAGWRMRHYARNEQNIQVSYEAAIRFWTEMYYRDALFHVQGDRGRNLFNRKFVSPDGHSEAVFHHIGNGCWVLATDPVNMGTYNFVAPNGILGYVGHGFADVLPYVIWGNTPDDPTTAWERVWGSYNGPTGSYPESSGSSQ